jgi:D-amino-acid dehydrogenase
LGSRSYGEDGMGYRIAVIGTGIIGASCAVELTRDGHAVTLIDPGEAGGSQAASHGNAGWISPASIVPISQPGLWKKIPHYLLDPSGPVTIRWRHLPMLLPWLVRFIAAGARRGAVERAAVALNGLLHDAPERHIALAAAIGAQKLVHSSELVYAYPDRAAFAADAASWRLRRSCALDWTEVEAEDLRHEELGLDKRYAFAAVVGNGAYCSDPAAYTAALARYAVRSGARDLRATATGFERLGKRLVAVLTDRGPVHCDKAVVCAGIGSTGLARAVGDKVPLVSERGYHVQLESACGRPGKPIMPSDNRFGITPMDSGIRAAGQVELASKSAPPDWRRADILSSQLASACPSCREVDPLRIKRWMGHRPSTPDGIPVIGHASGCADVYHAFGHGHVGLASAPITAKLIADLIGDRTAEMSIEPYSARRFRWRSKILTRQLLTFY